jgi:hypothetical protein
MPPSLLDQHVLGCAKARWQVERRICSSSAAGEPYCGPAMARLDGRLVAARRYVAPALSSRFDGNMRSRRSSMIKLTPEFAESGRSWPVSGCPAWPAGFTAAIRPHVSLTGCGSVDDADLTRLRLLPAGRHPVLDLYVLILRAPKVRSSSARQSSPACWPRTLESIRRLSISGRH